MNTQQNEIIEMARQAFACKHTALPVSEERLKAFAKLVADKEREACAKLCAEEAKNWKNPKYHYATAAAEHCYKAIRARGEA